MKETTNHKLRWPEPKDKDALSEYWKNLAEDTERELDKIAPKQITGVAEKQLLIANASGVVTAVTASGDVTNDKAGVFTIGNEKVTAPKLASKAVTDAKLGILRGRIKSDGSIISGTGFAAEKTATGIYKIKFTSEYSVQPVIVVTPFTGSIPRYANNAEVASPKKETGIKIWNKEGVAEDGSFEFIALEP